MSRRGIFLDYTFDINSNMSNPGQGKIRLNQGPSLTTNQNTAT